MSRRWRYPLSRRGSFHEVVPTSEAPKGFIRQATRRPHLRAARTRFLVVPSVGALPPPPPAFPAGFIRQSRRRVQTTRRAIFLDVPLIGATPLAPPALPPGFTRTRTRPSGSVRRGSYAEPPWTLPPMPPQFRCRQQRRQAGSSRRARFLSVPPGATVPLRFQRSSVRIVHGRRGVYAEPAWPQVAVAPYTPASFPVAATRIVNGTATPRDITTTAVSRDLNGTATTREQA